MLTLRQYLDSFTRKEHTAELHRLMAALGCTREHIYAMAKGKSTSLDMALSTYAATAGRVDPRTINTRTNWGVLDAYYRQEQPQAPTLPAAVARAGRSGVAAQAGNGVQRAGRKAGAQGAGQAARRGTTKV